MNDQELIKKLKDENRALKARCRILTMGTLCEFCPMECGDRKNPFIIKTINEESEGKETNDEI